MTSARSLRSTSIAAVCSETTIPSPPQVGHFFVITSRGPSVTFCRVISTSPSGEISTTYVFVRSRSSSVRERLLDGCPVLRVRHVDEVDDDDPADVAQPELAHDLLDRLEVVLRDRVLEPAGRALRARADEAAGVDVDDRERLGVVEDQVAARRQVDPAVERRADLLLDAERLHQRLALLVADDALDHVRRGLLQVADDPLVGAVVVDEQPLEVAGEEVAHDAQRQLGLLVDQRRRLRRPSRAPRSSSRGAAGSRGRAATSSADAPSAAVRTITPPFFGASSLRIPFSRLRSSSSSRRETPRPSPCGT